MEAVERRTGANQETDESLRASSLVESNEPTKPHIVFESLADPARSFVAYEGQTIGRSNQSDVVLDGIPDLDSVSRRMALVGRHGDSWFIQHLATTNYITVDGDEYDSDDEVVIRDGNIVGLALCQFFVRIPEVEG